MRASTWAVLRPEGELVERLAASREVDLHLHSRAAIFWFSNQETIKRQSMLGEEE